MNNEERLAALEDEMLKHCESIAAIIECLVKHEAMLEDIYNSKGQTNANLPEPGCN